MEAQVPWVPGDGAAAYDEMYDGTLVRPEYLTLRKSLDTLDGSDLRARIDTLASSYLDQGVTFDIGGEERAFPIDILPRIISSDAWSAIDVGVQQRVRAPRPVSRTRPSWSSRPGCSTAPTSSTPCSRARWAWSSSRAATWSAVADGS